MHDALIHARHSAAVERTDTHVVAVVDAGEHKVGLAVGHELADGEFDAVGRSATHLKCRVPLTFLHEMGTHGTV